jgi:threonine aldolase
VLAGRRADVDALVRYRRMLGGAMRQVGILAAAGVFALERNVEDLAEDHANAKLLADRLAGSPRIDLVPDGVETNIVVFRLAEGAPDAATVVDRARERGVLVFAFGPRTVRAVTHRDVDADACRRGAEVLAGVAGGSP